MKRSLSIVMLMSILVASSNAQNRFDLGGGGVGSTTDKMVFKQKEGTPAVEVRGDNHGTEYLDPINYYDLGAQGSFRLYTKNSPVLTPNQFPAPGSRPDRFWGLMYNADPASTGSLSAITDEPYFGFRWEDNWWQRQPPFAGEVFVITAISYSAPYTSITIDVGAGVGDSSKSTFKEFHTKCYVKRYKSDINTDYTIQWKVYDIVSPGVIRVHGNATSDLAVGYSICFTSSIIEHHDVIGRVGEPSQERFMAMQIAREVPSTLQEIISDNWIVSDAAGYKVLSVQAPYYNGSGKNSYVTGTIVSDSDNGSNTTFVITPAVAHASWVGKQIRFKDKTDSDKWKHVTISSITNSTTIVCNGVVYAGLDNTKFQIVSASNLILSNVNLSLDNNRGIQTSDTAGNGHNILMEDVGNWLVVGHGSFDAGVFLHKPILANYQDGSTCIVLGSEGGSNQLTGDDAGIIKFGASSYSSSTKIATFKSDREHIAMQASTAGGTPEIRMGTGAWSALDTNIYRQAANILATDDDFAIRTAGKGLQVKEGTNAKMGVATLVGGAATVSTTAAKSNARIFLTSQVDGGTPGFLRVSTRVDDTSFTITSSSASDTSTVAWMIVQPAQ